MKKATVTVFRFNPEIDESPYFQTFENMKYEETDTVLDVLLSIRAFADTTLSFRYSCQCTICGSCAMRINGLSKLVCETKIDDIVKDGEIKIEPLQAFTVIKDLVVDIESLIKELSIFTPWLIRDHSKPVPSVEYIIKPEEIDPLLEKLDRCIICGICQAASDANSTDRSIVGLVSMVKSLKYILHPLDAMTGARLRQLAEIGLIKHPDECGAVCPKGIDMTQDVLKPLKKKAGEMGLL